MRRCFVVAMLLFAVSAYGAESFLQLPADTTNTGKKLRMRTSVQGVDTVYSQGFFLDDGSGSGPLGIATNPIFVTFTNATIAATQSGTWNVTVANFPATQTIAGTVAVSNFPVTQPISGAVTISGTPAVTATVSNFPATQPVSGTIAVSNFPASSPASLAQSATSSVTWTSASTLNSTVNIATVNMGAAWLSINETGSITAGSIVAETTDDNVNWRQTAMQRQDLASTLTVAGALASGSVLYAFPVAGTLNARIRLSVVITGTGSALLNLTASAAARDPIVGVNGVTGIVTTSTSQVNGATTLTGNGVTGTGSQRVTIASDNTPFTVNAQQATGTNLHTVVDSGTVSVSNFPATQTVTQAAGSTIAVTQATAANLNATVAGTVGVNNFPATQTVAGTVTANAGTGTFIVGQATGTNLHVVVDTAPTTAVTGTFFQATQPVSGTVTANAGTGTFAENLAQIGATAVVTGGVAGSLAIGGTQANNAAIIGNPIIDGAEAISTQPVAATTGNARRLIASLDGAVYTRAGGPVKWSCGLTGISTTLTQCQAAPAAGLSLYVHDVLASSNTTAAGSFLLRYGTGTNCATGTVTLYPNIAAQTTGIVPYPANTATPTVLNFTVPLVVPAANALCVVCVATNTCVVAINGFTAP